jgi:protein-disulfide isomerase
MPMAPPKSFVIDSQDHVRGRDNGPVTLIAYCDFECPYSGKIFPAIHALLQQGGNRIRYIFRHFPLPHKHPHAQQAAEAVEAAGAQGRFWEMHDLLFTHQAALEESDLFDYALELGVNHAVFEHALRERTYAKRVYRDVAGGRRHGVTGTPTFFLNQRQVADEDNLPDLVRKALVETQSEQ